MNKEQMEKKLVEAIGKYGLGIGSSAAEKAALKLKTNAYFEVFEIDDISVLKIRDLLINIGTILDENIEKKEYTAQIGGGIANLNPAIVVIQLKGRELSVSAYAKEGLIKQHTAEKVVQRVKQSLSNN